jgi:arginase
MKPELIGVPYTSAAAGGGIANAIGVLRESGLTAAVDARDLGDLDVPQGNGVRGASGLLSETGLAHLAAATHHAVSESLDNGGFPMIVGGDCPVLLGALAAGRDRLGSVGLLFVDGHEDAWPGRVSTTGEASDSEVAIALGVTSDLPEPLGSWVPLVTPETIAMLGPRDRNEIEGAGVTSLAHTVAMFCDDTAVRAMGTGEAARQALQTLTAAAGFWLHIDLDVLSTDEFPAADYTQPGGLTWDELFEIAAHAVRSPACFGCSVSIYNPDLDPDRACARRLIRFIGDLVAASHTTSNIG